MPEFDKSNPSPVIRGLADAMKTAAVEQMEAVDGLSGNQMLSVYLSALAALLWDLDRRFPGAKKAFDESFAEVYGKGK